jgi:hypothetical protein
MNKRIRQTFFALLGAPMLLQVGCFNAADFQAIAEGQFIMFVNALINSVTSDVLRGAIGG